MRTVVLITTLLGFCKGHPSFSIVPSYEYPSEHQYPIDHGQVFDIPPDIPDFQHKPGHHHEIRTHVQHPTNGVSQIYYNRFDDIGEKFNFNIGKGTYNIKNFPIEPQRQTYVAPDGLLYIYSFDKNLDKQVPYKAPNMKQKPTDLFTGNRANASVRPNTNFNRNLPRRTNQLGIPSAALASLAGGGLG